MKIWVGVLALLFLSSCNYYERKISVTEGTEKTTFAVIQREVTQVYCSRCHNGADPDVPNLNIAYEEYLEQGLITKGKPADSPYYEQIARGAMPPRGPKPPQVLVDKLRAWIEAGADKQ
jgi:cytochrome c553